MEGQNIYIKKVEECNKSVMDIKQKTKFISSDPLREEVCTTSSTELESCLKNLLENLIELNNSLIV